MNCLFCKIIRKEIPAKTHYEDENILAFYDISPQAPTHLLIIPKKHVENISALGNAAQDAELIAQVILGAKQIAATLGLKDYRLIFNNGPEAGQTVFHIHLHLLSGRKMTWPPG